MRRYARIGPRRGARPRLRRYVRDPLPDLDVIIEYVDEVVVRDVEAALRRRERGRARWWSSLLGRHGDFKFTHVARLGGRTVSVFDIVFDRRNLRIIHLGMKGLRGWDPSRPDRVDFPREYEVEGLRRRKR